MARTELKSVDEYIAMQSQKVQGALDHLRRAIRRAVPEAEEMILYEMPTYKLHGRRMLQFAAWARHYALYTAASRIVAEFPEELARHKVRRGTIQFPISEPVPVQLIERIAKFRAKEIARGAELPTHI